MPSAQIRSAVDFRNQGPPSFILHVRVKEPVMLSAASFVGAALLSELGAAELVLGAVVGAGLLLYPVVDFASRHVPHRSRHAQRA
jgi:hypothetical protein